MITALHQIFGRKYTQPIPIDSFLAYNFNGNLLDSSGNGRNATQNGTITYTTGRKGVPNTAIQFGSGNIVTPTLPASSVWSISFWFKTNSTANTIWLELSPFLNTINGFLSTINNDGSGKIRGYINSVNNANVNHKFTNNSFNNNNWHHLVLILDRTQPASNEIKIYVDKVLQSLSSTSNSEQLGNYTSENLYIGARGTTLTQPYNGAMDDFKIFNRPLTQTEITNLYNE